VTATRATKTTKVSKATKKAPAPRRLVRTAKAAASKVAAKATKVTGAKGAGKGAAKAKAPAKRALGGAGRATVATRKPVGRAAPAPAVKTAPGPRASKGAPARGKQPSVAPSGSETGAAVAAPAQAAAARKPAAVAPAPPKVVAPPPPPPPPVVSDLDDKFLDEQRILLLEERLTYLEQAEALKAEADSLAQDMEPGDIQFDDESGEGGTINVERERDLALSAQARASVEEIDHALAKIANRTYGLCERCGQPIPRPRLKALPYARLCVACKSGGLSRR
jgi:DnaK suppressor protein